jgi:glycyl-tRNA synthetase alpha subunit
MTLRQTQDMRQGAQYLHRNNWPETDVGAGLPAMRRAGGARSLGAKPLKVNTSQPPRPTKCRNPANPNECVAICHFWCTLYRARLTYC